MAGKYDDMSFGKAFAAARKEMGGGKTFTYKGKSYSTNTKDDEAAKTKSAPRPKARPEEMTTRSRSDSYVSSGRGSEESADRMAKRAREPRAAAIYDAVRGRAQRNRDAAEVRSAADSASSTMRRARQEEAMDDLELRGVRGYKDGGMVRNAGRAQVSGKGFRGSF